MGISGRPKKVNPRIDNLDYDIRHRDFETAKLTLKEFGINVQDGDGRTALIHSVLENRSEFVKWLVEHGADLNIQDRSGYSALHVVGLNHLTEIGKYILSKSPNLELRDEYGNTPLWTSVMNSQKSLAVVKLLLDHGANLDNVNDAGRTPAQMLKTLYGDSFENKIEREC